MGRGGTGKKEGRRDQAARRKGGENLLQHRKFGTKKERGAKKKRPMNRKQWRKARRLRKKKTPIFLSKISRGRETLWEKGNDV